LHGGRAAVNRPRRTSDTAPTNATIGLPRTGFTRFESEPARILRNHGRMDKANHAQAGEKLLFWISVFILVVYTIAFPFRVHLSTVRFLLLTCLSRKRRYNAFKLSSCGAQGFHGRAAWQHRRADSLRRGDARTGAMSGDYAHTARSFIRDSDVPSRHAAHCRRAPADVERYAGAFPRAIGGPVVAGILPLAVAARLGVPEGGRTHSSPHVHRDL